VGLIRAADCPVRGLTAANRYVHLQILAQEAGPQVQVVLVLDGAGWHVAKALQVPHNITLLHLPPYSPELNPVERVWAYLRQHYLSNRVYHDYDDLMQETTVAWNRLDPTRLQTICRTNWISRAN
jgi:transposase